MDMYIPARRLREEAMKIIGIILIIVGIVGILLGAMMFGDIGVAAMIGALAALLSGIGFILCSKAINAVSQQ